MTVCSKQQCRWEESTEEGGGSILTGTPPPERRHANTGALRRAAGAAPSTHGKHLWLRNNLSTIPSQVVDTATVLVLLCAVGEIGWERFGALLLNGVMFKSLVAAADTPLIYVCVGWMRRRFNLAEGQEVDL